jgi:hypothetical protein
VQGDCGVVVADVGRKLHTKQPGTGFLTRSSCFLALVLALFLTLVLDAFLALVLALFLTLVLDAFLALVLALFLTLVLDAFLALVLALFLTLVLDAFPALVLALFLTLALVVSGDLTRRTGYDRNPTHKSRSRAFSRAGYPQ